MGRSFNGTSDFLSSTSALDLSTQHSLSVWLRFNWTTFANNDDLLLESSANSNLNAGAFALNPNNSSDGTWHSVLSTTGTGGTHYSSVSIARPTAGAWHTFAINIDASNAGQTFIRDVWLDGAHQTPTVILDDRTTVTMGIFTWYFMSRGGTTLFAAGDLAQVAVWGAASGSILTAGDIASLQAGNWDTPLTTEAGSLKYYWKVAGTASPEPDSADSIALLVHGTSQVSAPGETSIPDDSLAACIWR